MKEIHNYSENLIDKMAILRRQIFCIRGRG
mgnify:CR=1 FL=1